MGDSNKKKIDSGDVVIFVIIFEVILVIAGIFAAETGNAIMFQIWIFFQMCNAIIFIGAGVMAMGEKEAKNSEIIENMNKFQLEYDEYVSKSGIIKSDAKATLLNEGELHLSIPHYLWIENDTLHLFPMAEPFKEWFVSAIFKPDISELELKSIPIDSILYFEEVGELRRYATVSGGGSSLKGGLLGYAVAADVGAIIGSREPVKTEIVSEDDRRIELIYKNHENEMSNLEFAHDAYEVLQELIPSKELRRIVALNAVQREKSADSEEKEGESTKEKLRKLSELKEEGLINEEEFLEQKKRILDMI